MPNKITNNIVSIDNEIYNYLNDVNYGMNKPQFQHLTSIVLGFRGGVTPLKLRNRYLGT